jgi:hypothetical protein
MYMKNPLSIILSILASTINWPELHGSLLVPLTQACQGCPNDDWPGVSREQMQWSLRITTQGAFRRAPCTNHLLSTLELAASRNGSSPSQLEPEAWGKKLGMQGPDSAWGPSSFCGVQCRLLLLLVSSSPPHSAYPQNGQPCKQEPCELASGTTPRRPD